MQHIPAPAPRLAPPIKPLSHRAQPPFQLIPKAQAPSTSLQASDPYAFIPSNYDQNNKAPNRALKPSTSAAQATFPLPALPPKPNSSKGKRTSTLPPLRKRSSKSPPRPHKTPPSKSSEVTKPTSNYQAASRIPANPPAANVNSPKAAKKIVTDIYNDDGFGTYSDSSDGEEDLFGNVRGVGVEKFPFPCEKSDGGEVEESEHAREEDMEDITQSSPTDMTNSKKINDYVISGSDWAPSSEDEDDDSATPAYAESPFLQQKEEFINAKKKRNSKIGAAMKKIPSASASAAQVGPKGTSKQLMTYNATRNALAMPLNPLKKNEKKSVLPSGPTEAGALLTACVAAQAGTVKPRKPRSNLASQSTLAVNIPARVVKDPQGTAVLMELPPGAEVAGAAGVVGRIIRGNAANVDHAQHAADYSSDGIILDLMGKGWVYWFFFSEFCFPLRCFFFFPS